MGRMNQTSKTAVLNELRLLVKSATRRRLDNDIPGAIVIEQSIADIIDTAKEHGFDGEVQYYKKDGERDAEEEKYRWDNWVMV